MSERTPQPERPPRPERVAGIFIAVSWAAVVFALFGILSVLLDRDPIELPVGPYYGVISIFVSLGVVYLGVITTVPRPSPWAGAVGTAAGVYLAIVVTAAFVDLGLAFAQASSIFVLVATVTAAIPPIGAWAWLHPSRPRMRGRRFEGPGLS